MAAVAHPLRLAIFRPYLGRDCIKADLLAVRGFAHLVDGCKVSLYGSSSAVSVGWIGSMLVVTAADVAFEDARLWSIQEEGSKVREDDYGKAHSNNTPAVLLLNPVISYGPQRKTSLPD